MPLALIVALAASLGVHALALFVPDIEFPMIAEPPALQAELPPLPKARPPAEPLPQQPRKAPRARPPKASAPPTPLASTTPVLSIPESSEAADFTPLAESLPETKAEPEGEPPQTVTDSDVIASRMPARGTIRYRVDRGERGFELGRSVHAWEFVDGRYRITSVTETTGLAALLKPLRVDLESRGRLTAEGLQPEHFIIRRDGKSSREQADFDWERMQVRIGGDDAGAVTQPLTQGAQDLLSFNYQLGFLPHPEARNNLPIASGKKFTTYPLEAIGDEEIEIPAGVFRTLHLLAPGDNVTELWLAYDYLLLPVKIRHIDRHGDSFVQVATEILLSKD